MVLTGLVANLC